MTRDELVTVLKASFKGPIVEADEWRPLADYIMGLVELQRQSDIDYTSGLKMYVGDAVNKAPKIFEDGR